MLGEAANTQKTNKTIKKFIKNLYIYEKNFANHNKNRKKYEKHTLSQFKQENQKKTHKKNTLSKFKQQTNMKNK